MTAAFDQVAMGLDAGTPVPLASVSEPDAIRVLLIKDGAIDRGFLANELSKQGFAVQTVASLAGAPDAVGNADVIVLHCDWTKVSSIDLLDILQRQAAGVPIVLLTGEASPAREGLALDKGAIDVIGQSRSSEVLARRLKDVVKAFGRTDQPQAGGNDLRQTAFATRYKQGLLEGRGSRPHPRRIQHRLPAGFERGSVRDIPGDLRPAAL